MPLENFFGSLQSGWQDAMLGFFATQKSKIKTAEALTAFFVGLIAAIITLGVLGREPKEKQKIRKAKLLHEKRLVADREELLGKNQKRITGLRSNCEKWRLFISDGVVTVMRDFIIRGLAVYDEVPLPITVLSVIYSSILGEHNTSRRIYKPQVLYAFCPEYPEEYLSEISSKLEYVKIKTISIDSFDSEETMECVGISPTCGVETELKRVCSVCSKSPDNVKWCDGCNTVAYCSPNCVSQDKDHSIVCSIIKDRQWKLPKDMESFPFRDESSKKILEYRDICNELIRRKVHGKGILRKLCTCYQSIDTGEILGLMALTIMSKNGFNVVQSITHDVAHRAWDALIPYTDSNQLYRRVGSLSWKYIYAIMHIPEDVIGSLIFYVPFTLWYLLVVTIVQGLVSGKGTESSPIVIHIVNADEELDYVFLIKSLHALMPELYVDICVFVQPQMEVAPPLTILSAILSPPIPKSRVNFFTFHSHQDTGSYVRPPTESPTWSPHMEKPDMLLIYTSKGVFERLERSIKSALMEMSWVVFVSDNPIECETTLIKAVRSQHDLCKIIQPHINPFRRPGTIPATMYNGIHSWKWGYISGLKIKQ